MSPFLFSLKKFRFTSSRHRPTNTGGFLPRTIILPLWCLHLAIESLRLVDATCPPRTLLCRAIPGNGFVEVSNWSSLFKASFLRIVSPHGSQLTLRPQNKIFSGQIGRAANRRVCNTEERAPCNGFMDTLHDTPANHRAGRQRFQTAVCEY